MIDFVFLIVQNSCQQFLHLIQKGVTNIYAIIILSNMSISSNYFVINSCTKSCRCTTKKHVHVQMIFFLIAIICSALPKT